MHTNTIGPSGGTYNSLGEDSRWLRSKTIVIKEGIKGQSNRSVSNHLVVVERTLQLVVDQPQLNPEHRSATEYTGHGATKYEM